MPGLNECIACQDAIALDETALVLVDGGQPVVTGEVAIIACDTHLRRLVLALEVLDALERVERFQIPPLVDPAFEARLAAIPNRRLP